MESSTMFEESYEDDDYEHFDSFYSEICLIFARIRKEFEVPASVVGILQNGVHVRRLLPYSNIEGLRKKLTPEIWRVLELCHGKLSDELKETKVLGNFLVAIVHIAHQALEDENEILTVVTYEERKPDAVDIDVYRPSCIFCPFMKARSDFRMSLETKSKATKKTRQHMRVVHLRETESSDAGETYFPEKITVRKYIEILYEWVMKCK